MRAVTEADRDSRHAAADDRLRVVLSLLVLLCLAGTVVVPLLWLLVFERAAVDSVRGFVVAQWIGTLTCSLTAGLSYNLASRNVKALREENHHLCLRMDELASARALAEDVQFRETIAALAADVERGIERPAGVLEDRLRRRSP